MCMRQIRTTYSPSINLSRFHDDLINSVKEGTLSFVSLLKSRLQGVSESEKIQCLNYFYGF